VRTAVSYFRFAFAGSQVAKNITNFREAHDRLKFMSTCVLACECCRNSRELAFTISLFENVRFLFGKVLCALQGKRTRDKITLLRFTLQKHGFLLKHGPFSKLESELRCNALKLSQAETISHEYVVHYCNCCSFYERRAHCIQRTVVVTGLGMVVI